MTRRNIPEAVLDKLKKFERGVEQLKQQVAQTQDAIDAARHRLTGGFQKDEEYSELYATLKQLVAEKPVLEAKRDAAQSTLATCQDFLDALPNDVTLELVKTRPTNGVTLDAVRTRIRKHEEELAELAAVPVPSADMRQRVENYVRTLSQPRITGILKGETLRVTWPDERMSVLALLLGDRMVEVLSREVERMANDPMPLQARQRRIAELKGEIDAPQRQALALGATGRPLPPEILLGVKVVRPPRQMRAHRQQRTERPERVPSVEVEA